VKRSRIALPLAALAIIAASAVVVVALAGDAVPRAIADTLGLDAWLPGSGHPDSSGPVWRSPVDNFGVIWEGKITRSGKPDDDAGWEWLRKRGVVKIVNFRKDNQDVDYDKFGLGCLWMPLSGGESPTDEKAVEFLTYVQQPENQPVHIMCAEGKDRTGTMSALIRYSIDGWSIDEALAEAARYRKGEALSPERTEWLRGWAKRNAPGSYRLQASTQN
jgi:hypothetical protein